jgi:hypothetical protein
LACDQDLLLKVSHKAGIFIPILSQGVDERILVFILIIMPQGRFLIHMVDVIGFEF